MMMDMTSDNLKFANNILFSAEAISCLKGFVNRHNYCQQSNETNVWAGIIGQHIIGQQFTNKNAQQQLRDNSNQERINFRHQFIVELRHTSSWQ